jgi:hypothetical protein
MAAADLFLKASIPVVVLAQPTQSITANASKEIKFFIV